jgi:hypothetical protein
VQPLTTSLRRQLRCLRLPDAGSGKLADMLAALLSSDLLVGLGLGLFLGLLVSPVIRSWLTWREWVSASREADLVADVLDRMEVAPWPHPEPEGEAKDVIRQGPRRDAP